MVNGETPKATILVVDDIPDTVQLLKDWLDAHNFKTLGVTSSLQALEVAEKESPDLILLDVMMPRMDGMETCRRLKANPNTAEIPVILVTAKNPSDARAEGMMAGAVDYIAKPVNLTDLIVRIETALANTVESPVDVERLLEEVAHSALAILSAEMVWVLGADTDEGFLNHRVLATTGGARIETEFLSKAANGSSVPRYSLQDTGHPFSSTLLTRKTIFNFQTESLRENPSTLPLYRATELLRLNYLTMLPLIAAGKTPGVMILGTLQPHDMETPRARQTLTALGSQAAITLDYSRLITDLTDRENEMRQEQTFRQMILDTMSDGLAVIDSKGSIKYVNRRLLRMTNYPKGFLEGRSVGELFHPDDRIEVMMGLLREGAATMKFDQRLITRENKVLPVWLTRSRAQDDTNNQVIVLSDMTEQKRREFDLERQTGRLQALNQAAHTIAASLSLAETLSNILNSALAVVEAEGASLFLISRENPGELIAVAAEGAGSERMQGLRVSVGEGVVGWVAREAQSQLVADAARDPRFFRGVDEHTGISTHSLMAVPLISAERVIGVIEVVNKTNYSRFDQNDVHLLESMAGTAAVSIVNARLFDETNRRVTELTAMLKASEAASSTLQFAQVLEGIARNLTNGLEVARCTIMAWNAPKNRLESLAEIADVWWPSPDAPRRPLADEPLTRAAISSGLPVLASLHGNELSDEERAGLTSIGMISMIIVPLYVRSEIQGLANLYSIDTHWSYSDADAEAVNNIMIDWEVNIPHGSNLLNASSAILNDLADRLSKVGRTCWTMIRAWVPNQNTTLLLRERGFAEWTRRPGMTLPIEQYRTMQTAIANRQVQIRTLDSLENDPGEHDWLVYRGGRSCMIVPLLERGVTVGIVKLMSQDGRIFDEGEVRLAQGIANVVSSAMENARLYQSLDSRARALESAYKELQEVDRVKDEFIQNVSHELRTPLISVLGYGGLLAEEQLGPINEQQREALTTIVQKSQKLADLVQDIVSVQALENRTYDRKPLDMGELVRGVLERYTPRAQEAGLRFNTQFSPNVPPVLADGKMIVEALEKLLDNALKFGSEGANVDVLVQDTDGPNVQVMVRDYGIGIDSSEHQKIFQRFYQVDGGTARRYAGTGLGLAIAKAIIEGQGGRIGVKSKPAEGASFVFTLPKYATLIKN